MKVVEEGQGCCKIGNKQGTLSGGQVSKGLAALVFFSIRVRQTSRRRTLLLVQADRALISLQCYCCAWRTSHIAMSICTGDIRMLDVHF